VQQIGGIAMIALSEFVGLPTLIVLLAAWVGSDAAGQRHRRGPGLDQRGRARRPRRA